MSILAVFEVPTLYWLTSAEADDSILFFQRFDIKFRAQKNI